MPNLVWLLFLGLCHTDLTVLHTTDLLRCQGSQKDYKRPTKVRKAKSKARDWRILILIIFMSF